MSRVSRASLASAQSQARLQVASEDAGHIEYELLEPERDADGRAGPEPRVAGACRSRSPATCSSTSRVPGTTPRTGRSSGSSTCSASSTRRTPTHRGRPATPRSGPSTGGTRSGPSRNSSTSSPTVGSGRLGCTSTTTTTTSRRRSIISPNCTRPVRRPSVGSWAGSRPARTRSTICSGAACSSTCTGSSARASAPAWRAIRSSGSSRCAATPGRWTCGMPLPA